MTPPDWYYDRYAALDLPEPAMGDWMEPWDGPPRGIPAKRAHMGSVDPSTRAPCTLCGPPTTE